MRRLFITLLIIIANLSAISQCLYTVTLEDSYGDGWNGNSLDVLVDGIVVLNDITIDDGYSGDVTFSVNSGDQITTSFNATGTFETETSYTIYDSEGNPVGTGDWTSSGDITSPIVAICPNSCNLVNSIIFSNITTSSSEFNWSNSSGTATSWNIEYGLSGYSQGSGTSTNVLTNSHNISGLSSNTAYDIYIQTVCGSETTSFAGPFSFTTLQEGACGYYTLSLSDLYTDGWNGASISVIINGSVSETFTIPDGSNSETFNVVAIDGDIIEFSFSGGTWDNEITFTITDPFGNVITDENGNDIEDYDAPPDGTFTNLLDGCPCASNEYANISVTQDCDNAPLYDLNIQITDLGSGSSFADIYNNGSLAISNVGAGTHNLSDLSGINAITVINENECTTTESFNICDPCSNPSAPSDEPCDAPSVDLSQDFIGSTYCTYTVSSGSAATSTGGPNEFCATAHNDSWLIFTAASDTVILDWSVGNCSGGIGSTMGVQLAIFDGDCNDQDGMSLLACEESAYNNDNGTLTVPNLTIGNEYFIYIDGVYGSQCDYTWTPVGGVAITPPNDTCGNATLIACGDLDTSNNILASNIDAPASCNGLTPNVGVWYKYVGNGTDVTLSTDNITTNFDTQIFLYSGDCDNLECIDSDDDSGVTSGTSQIEFEAEDGTDYYIYVGGDDSSSTPIGQFGLSILCTSCEADAGNWD